MTTLCSKISLCPGQKTLSRLCLPPRKSWALFQIDYHGRDLVDLVALYVYLRHTLVFGAIHLRNMLLELESAPVGPLIKLRSLSFLLPKPRSSKSLTRLY